MAVDAADREHYNPDDAILRSTSMVVMLAESFIQDTATRITKLRTQLPLAAGNATGQAPRSGLACLHPDTLQMLRARSQALEPTTQMRQRLKLEAPHQRGA